MIKEALLGLLAAGPKHGYDLKLTLEQVLGQTSKVNVGQVYTALAKLEHEGLVAPEPDEGRGGGPKTYSLTGQGRGVLSQWLAAPVERVELRDELFIKLSLARRMDPDKVPVIIRTQRRSYLQSIQELTGLRERHNEDGETEIALLMDNAILHLEADMRWLELWEGSVARKE